ncbi:MAG: HEAT repeat domain-containing protein [Phycisphaeraceae bacterium]
MTTNRPTPTRVRRVLACLICAVSALLAPHSARAQQPTKGIDLDISPGDVYSQRFSWLHWWETQRASYQRFDSVDARARWSFQRLNAVEPHRQAVIDKLVPILKDADADPYTKAGAVVALARLRYDKLLELIVADAPLSSSHEQILGPEGEPWPLGLVGDGQVRVRVAGWLALGLLDTPESRAKLTDEFLWAVMPDDQIARVAAFGLLSKLTDAERQFLVMKMRNSEVAEVQRMALWALQQHDTQANDRIMGQAIEELLSPYSVSQALMSKPTMRRHKPYGLLTNVIEHQDQLAGLTVFRTISEGTVWQSPVAFDVSKQLSVSAMLALMEMPPAPGKQGLALNKALRRAVLEGPAEPSKHDEGVPPEFIALRVANYERGPAALALAMQATPDGDLNDNLDALVDLIQGKTTAKVYRFASDQGSFVSHRAKVVSDTKYLEQKEHPARGYAAVAMGLMLQRMNEDTRLGRERPLSLNASGRWNHAVGKLSRPLTRALENKYERTDVRCAAAIGMGLSGFDGFREPLHEALQNLDAGEEALYGYIVEALAMLDDPEAPALAEKYLTQITEVRSDNDPLARRALASALVFSGDTPATIDDVIADAWGHDPYVGLALAKASAVRGNGKLIGVLLERLDDPAYATAAAMSLAELVDMEDPWRLSPLTDGMNYTLDYRTPAQASGSVYYGDNPPSSPNTPSTPEPLPTRLVAGFDNPYLMHALLTRRLPTTTTGSSVTSVLDNDDSNGNGSFLFGPQPKQEDAQ